MKKSWKIKVKRRKEENEKKLKIKVKRRKEENEKTVEKLRLKEGKRKMKKQ